MKRILLTAILGSLMVNSVYAEEQGIAFVPKSKPKLIDPQKIDDKYLIKGYDLNSFQEELEPYLKDLYQRVETLEDNVSSLIDIEEADSVE